MNFEAGTIRIFSWIEGLFIDKMKTAMKGIASHLANDFDVINVVGGDRTANDNKAQR